ncbi:MAG: ROK family protein [Lachnospiraceae bacterium]
MSEHYVSEIKKNHCSKVYHYIYKHKDSSKQSIANALNMSLPTISQYLGLLLETSLIQKNGQLDSHIGRKAIAYSIIPTVKLALGVETHNGQITFVALNLYGHLVQYKSIYLPYATTPNYYHLIGEALTEFIKDLGAMRTQILGIGFAISELPLQQLEDQLHIPCHFSPVAQCAATTELWKQPKLNDAILLSLDECLDGAFLIHGNLYTGNSDKHNNIAHLTLIPDGTDCACGQKGCATCYCSVNALLEEGEQLSTFFKEKQQGVQERVRRWKSLLQHLSILIKNLHLIINSPVILEGSLASYITETDLEFLHHQIRKKSAFPEPFPFIFQGSTVPYMYATGAALTYITKYLESL